jgi:hypothetical protein
LSSCAPELRAAHCWCDQSEFDQSISMQVMPASVSQIACCRMTPGWKEEYMPTIGIAEAPGRPIQRLVFIRVCQGSQSMQTSCCSPPGWAAPAGSEMRRYSTLTLLAALCESTSAASVGKGVPTG